MSLQQSFNFNPIVSLMNNNTFGIAVLVCAALGVIVWHLFLRCSAIATLRKKYADFEYLYKDAKSIITIIQGENPESAWKPLEDRLRMIRLAAIREEYQLCRSNAFIWPRSTLRRQLCLLHARIDAAMEQMRKICDAREEIVTARCKTIIVERETVGYTPLVPRPVSV